MNKGLLALNIILLVAVGALFFLFFKKKDKDTINTTARPYVFDTSHKWQNIPVAYFEMDSVEENFILWKQATDEMMKKEQVKDDSINLLKGNFNNYVKKLQPYFQNMNDKQRDSLNILLGQMDNEWRNKAAELNQRYQADYATKQTEIITQIKNYCKEFNKERRYSYIIAKEQGLFYYTDTAFNITTELVKGMNAFYSKKNK